MIKFLKRGGMMLNLFRFLALVFLLAACTNQSTSSTESIANNILENNPQADIFLFNDRIYESKELVHSININELEEVGKITKSHEKKGSIEENMATSLPVGTKIYFLKGSENKDHLYVRKKEGVYKYVAETEG
ncbi:hypothetical protein ACOJQI_16310 [Bacillus salacetis]|uniref:hypothetical protein n=1 Tax=Bacillus salacetis TaxID=2315464 RepID=UPI003B9E983D